MKKWIFTLFWLCCFQGLIAQSANRRIMIAMILTSPHHQIKKLVTAHNPSSALLLSNSSPVDFRFSDPIPKFELPKGSIVCRFEEYVQIHSPMKLNIGLAGQ